MMLDADGRYRPAIFDLAQRSGTADTSVLPILPAACASSNQERPRRCAVPDLAGGSAFIWQHNVAAAASWLISRQMPFLQ